MCGELHVALQKSARAEEQSMVGSPPAAFRSQKVAWSFLENVFWLDA